MKTALITFTGFAGFLVAIGLATTSTPSGNSQSLPTIEFEVRRGQVAPNPMISKKADTISIKNRDKISCTNAIVTVDEYYTAKLDNTANSIPTGRYRNPANIAPEQLVLIVDPSSLNMGGMSPFKDKGGSEAPRAMKITKMKITCDEGESTFEF